MTEPNPDRTSGYPPDRTADHTPERWQRIDALVGAALDRASDTRDAYLESECGDDAALLAEVRSLLAAHDRTGLMDELAAEVAPLTATLRASGAHMEGALVGRYRVMERIGGGGMGVVYKARDERLERTVALKFLPPSVGTDATAIRRFQLEARTVASLEHPNICTIHEIGETDDGQLFIAMPLYAGETLQQRIARGPLAVADAISITIQMLRGLTQVHGRGTTHRDIKPSNIFVTIDGVVKLLDFGIAKLTDVTITGAAGPLGTIAYMSPEQATAETVDYRTDLWSVAVVLYEMLAGRRPYANGFAAAMQGANAGAAGSPSPIASMRSDVSPALDAILARALAIAPDARYQSAPDIEWELLSLGPAALVPKTMVPVRAREVAGAVTAASAPSESLPSVSTASVSLPLLPLANTSRRSRIAVFGTLAVVIGGAAWLLTDGTAAGGASRGAIGAASAAPSVVTMPSVAVLPFADRSAAHDQEFFSDGMTEEVIARLARTSGLRVASSTSTFAYKEKNTDIRTVGAELGVSAVVEGSVRREGDRLRISARLVNTADGYQLWSETYDRGTGDTFAIQDELARAIAGALRGKLVDTSGDTTAGGGVPGSANDAARPGLAAYDLYLKGRQALYLRGRYAWYSRTEKGLRSALDYFAASIAQGPTYAPAHSGLADAYIVLGFYDFMRPTEAFPLAETAAKRAVALDPSLAAPRATLAYVALYHRWDFVEAEREFRRAIELNPNYSSAHQWYGNLLVAAGRMPEAEAEMRRAGEIDPLALIAKAALGWMLYYAGQNGESIEQFRQTLELNPDYAIAHLWRGWTLQEMDSIPAAIAAHRRAVALTDSGALFVASLARALAIGGQRAEAERMLRRLEAEGASGHYIPSYEIAKVHDALGRRDSAFAWLERARVERAHSMVFLRIDPQLAGLRGDKRYEELVRRVFTR